MKRIQKPILFLTLFLLAACASHQLQIAENSIIKAPNKKEVEHTFYLLGDAGNASMNESTPAISALKEELQKADKNGTLVVLGDNIYEKGLQDTRPSPPRGSGSP